MKLFFNKNFILGLITFLLLIGSSRQVVASHNPNSADPVIPEKNGTYDDPDHKGVKVRVFVHPEKPVKTTLPSLVCELPDPDSQTTVGKEAWYLPSNWSYNLNPASTPSTVGSSNLATIAGNGFSDWSSATGNKITFSRGPDTTVSRQAYDGKNIIAWGRTSGSALGVTYIRYFSSTGLVVDVDTIMNKKFKWSWSNSNTCADTNSYDSENIMTHEIGHWIGLDDEYDAANFQYATMYGYGSKGEVKKNTLTTGDNAGAFAIYNP